MLAKLRLTRDELQRRRFDLGSQLIARQVLSHQGVMIIENAFASDFIESARHDFMRRYETCLAAPDGTQTLAVGHRRIMIPIEPHAVSGSPDLYANPFVIDLIHEFLGDTCVLGSLCAVVALPGAEAQHVHRDHPFLFGDSSFDVAVPPYAINVLVPLVDLTLRSGTTRVWPTSHHVWSDTAARELAADDVIAPAGSCCLMDYRLMHGGTPNQSDITRPLICMVYNRPWFRDSVNFARIPAVRVDRKTLEEIPAPYQAWFAAHIRSREA